jgi:hypothetical protein
MLSLIEKIIEKAITVLMFGMLAYVVGMMAVIVLYSMFVHSFI